MLPIGLLDTGIADGDSRSYRYLYKFLISHLFMSKFRLYNSLNKFYTGKAIWKEVDEALSEEGFVDDGSFYEPFTNLIIGILSQNTSDRNCTKAYIGLIKKFKKITPEILSKAKISDIKKAIKPGGLYNIKSRRLKEFSKTILEKGNKSFFKKVLSLPKKEAIKELLKIKGLGIKTVEVFLAYCGEYDTLPIDTNIKRVVKRLGLVKGKANYKQIQEALKNVLPKGKKVRGHELFIRIGRDFCTSRKHLCKDCPVSEYCNKIV